MNQKSRVYLQGLEIWHLPNCYRHAPPKRESGFTRFFIFVLLFLDFTFFGVKLTRIFPLYGNAPKVQMNGHKGRHCDLLKELFSLLRFIIYFTKIIPMEEMLGVFQSTPLIKIFFFFIITLYWNTVSLIKDIMIAHIINLNIDCYKENKSIIQIIIFLMIKEK